MPITVRVMWQTKKIKKKTDDALIVVMDKNPDILKTLGAKKTHQVLVGFAAETQNLLLMPAKGSQEESRYDCSQRCYGCRCRFNSDTNIVKFLYANGDVCELEQMPKVDVANRILDEALRIRNERV